MSGETDLDVLLASMEPRLEDGVYVFATLDDPSAAAAMSPRMMFLEREGWTVILPRDAAEAAGLAHEFPCRMITLDIHSSLEAVGFLARITPALAAAGMGVNPVSAFHHDHLFVPEARADEAMRILKDMAAAANR